MTDMGSQFPPSRIAVIGSCITLQVLRTLGIGRGQIVVHGLRTSFAGLIPPTPDCPVIDALILTGRSLEPAVERWLSAELSKSIPQAIARHRPDLLIVDLIEERFDLLMLDSGLVVNESWDLVSNGLPDLPELASARRIDRLSDEAWTQWEQGMLRFRRWMDRQGQNSCRIVLLRTSWAEVQRTPGGRLTPLPDATVIMPGRIASRQAHNERLERCHAHFQALFPEAVVVEAPPETHVADPDHIWGLEPFHYIPAFYEAVARRLDELGIRPRPMT
ncbi:DUF6270 domain-containing protein [Azospirillum sp. A29]|jgi:hypothetical protein|uniref:DUF6270 domain-containing protein n=1 Tax=Azospirillum sp. A29 TaxID=3160606 RepID=UPI00366FDF7D